MTQAPSDPPLYLNFQDLTAPVRLEGAPALLPLIGTVLTGWPHEITQTPSADPCVTIAAAVDGYTCTLPGGAAPKQWDAVNTVCEMVVELAWEQIRSNPSWLCLHCAAVELNGRLVLFPNRRRAGKSTLTAVLAQRGHRVFTDDFLPVEIDAQGHMCGRANGILPRIRLPLPDSFSEVVKDWVRENPGPANTQYKYLEIDRLAPRGAALPIGAVVILDRDGTAQPSLNPVSPPVALDEMIAQNFARTLHSGRILRASHGVAEAAELHRLHYASAEDAADLLETRFQSWAGPVKTLADQAGLHSVGADLSLLHEDKPRFFDDLTYTQAPDVTEVVADTAAYLSDASGIGVHRLNEGSVAIWRLLEEPGTLAEVTDVLSEIFPDVPRARIEADSRTTLSQFAANRLIVPLDAARQRQA